MFKSMLSSGAVILVVFGLSGLVSAQWTETGASQAGRFKAWREQEQDYSPTLAIGASSLAFAPDETLYLACEKYPDILVFDKGGARPGRIPLKGLNPGVDIEGMSFCNDVLYLVDEDIPCLYSTSLENPGTVSTISIPQGIIMNAADIEDPNKTDKRSIEGLIVTKHRYPKNLQAQDAETYVYLLDERDEALGGGKEAKIYVGTLNNDRVTFVGSPVVFPLTRGRSSKEWFRLCELFEFQGKLYALKTLYDWKSREGEYHVVELDMEAKVLRPVCNITTYVNGLSGEFDTNFEGAAVHPDGRLFLTADNENYTNDEIRAGGRTPLGPRGRKCTPLICLPLKQ